MTVERVPLSGKDWAEVDRDKFTIEARFKYLAAYDAALPAPEPGTLSLPGEYTTRLLAGWTVILADLIVAWSLDLPVPAGNVDIIKALPSTTGTPLYQWLSGAIGDPKNPKVDDLMPDFSVSTVTADNPGSPTEP